MLDLVRVIATAALTLVLMLGPGLVLRAHGARGRVALGFVPLPGLALLAGTGSLAWILAPRISPRAVSALIVIPVLVWLLASVLRFRSDELVEAAERWALLVAAVVLGIAVARALWSLGPSGELNARTISRTLEVGDRPDSRIPFGVVQLVAHGGSPFGAVANSYFAPYNFSARGPLAGLASSPLVFLAGGKPPTGLPNQPWAPFDGQGFMAYRLAMMAFASTAFLSVWTLARQLASERAARLALLLAAATPFLVHEVWFTWPKLLAGSLVLLAAVALIDGRAPLAGLLLGAAYLVHPMALFSFPALFLLALWPLAGAQFKRPRWAPALLFLTGVAACVLAWRVVNGSHYIQGDFIHYFTQAGRGRYIADRFARAFGGHPAAPTVWDWVSDRFVSVTNTLVPLRLVFFSAHDPSINLVNRSCYPLCAGHSPTVVHFFFQYWTTLPFGVGIAFFPLLAISLWRAARNWEWPIFVAIFVPFALFAVYWGDAATGLLREGLHAWVLTLFVAVAVQQQRDGFAWLKQAPIRALLALRSVEVLLVALLPTIATRHRLAEQPFALTDSIAVAAMVVLSAFLGAMVWREGARFSTPRPPPGSL